MKLTPHIYNPVPRLRVSGAIPPFCVIRAVHSDKLIFFSRNINRYPANVENMVS